MLHTLSVHATVLAVVVVLAGGWGDVSPPAAFVETSPGIVPPMAPSPPDTTQRKPLRLLMVGLSQDMDRISDGIWYEDYEMMAAGGRAIAEHPKIPPEQIITIKEAIDDQFQQFVQYDEDVHRTAAELAEAAAERNLSAVLEKYNRIQRGCVGCHAAFRDRVRKALR